jgi:folate-binding protein YgfZ
MTENNLAVTIQASPLAALLASVRTPHELAACHGVLTPQVLDAPARETEALASGAAVHDLGWMRRVDVRGEDRFRWLSGMVTNTVNDLFPNTGAWNLILNAQGHILGDLTVWREGEELSPQRRNTVTGCSAEGDPLLGTPFAGESGVELELAADQYEKLMAHLNQFIIMDDVELVPLTGEHAASSETAVGLVGPLADEVLGRLGLPVFPHPMRGACVDWNGHSLRLLRGYGVLASHYELWVPTAGLALLWAALRTAGAAPVGTAALDAFRIAEGIPAYGVDMSERDLPQETAQMRALHFNKGCYLGQEVVERIHSRGGVHRHLRPLELSGPLPAAGTELTLDDGKPAGQITSVAELPLASGVRAFALGMVREEGELRSQAFTYTVGTATGTASILAAPPSLG